MFGLANSQGDIFRVQNDSASLMVPPNILEKRPIACNVKRSTQGYVGAVIPHLCGGFPRDLAAGWKEEPRPGSGGHQPMGRALEWRKDTAEVTTRRQKTAGRHVEKKISCRPGGLFNSVNIRELSEEQVSTAHVD